MPVQEASSSDDEEGSSSSSSSTDDLSFGSDPNQPKEIPEEYQNQWPEASLLPEWKNTMSEYFAAMRALAAQTVHLYMRSLNLPEDHIDAAFEQPAAVLRLLHYSTQPSWYVGVCVCMYVFWDPALPAW